MRAVQHSKDTLHGKKRKWTRILADTYKDFALNTSIHGLKYTVKNNTGNYEKLFWYLVVLAGFFTAGYMTVLFWNRYSMNPTRTTILSTFAPTTAVLFPAVTVCNVHKILQAKINEFLYTLNISEDEKVVLNRTFPQLTAFTSKDILQYNQTELNRLQEILNKSGKSNLVQVLKSLSQNCRELLIKCIWNSKHIDCFEVFEESLSNGGFCCSFNYALNSSKKVLLSPYSGRHSGLSVILNPMVQTNEIDNVKTSGGVRVLVHHPHDYPGSESIGKIISIGRFTSLQIRGTLLRPNYDIEELPVHQRNCLFDYERQLQLFPSKFYTSINCKSEERAKEFLRKCGCIPFRYGIQDKPICDATKITCIDNEMNEKINALYRRRQNCIPQCTETIYDVSSIQTNAYLNTSDILTPSLFAQNDLEENMIILNVYFMTDIQTILLRARITSTIYLLCSFGGVYSLFLGCSLMTIVEILYYFLFRFLVNLKLFPTISNETPSDSHVDNNHHHRKWATVYNKKAKMADDERDFYAYNTVFIN